MGRARGGQRVFGCTTTAPPLRQATPDLDLQHNLGPALAGKSLLLAQPFKDNSVVEYDLARLGPEYFAYLVRDLLRKVIGAEIPDVDVGASGIDSVIVGGISWPAGRRQEIWHGASNIRTVFFAEGQPLESRKQRLLGRIKQDLDQWSHRPEELNRRGERIENVFYVSNIIVDGAAGLPDAAKGDLQSRIDALIDRDYRHLELKASKVWGYNQLAKGLSANQEVRARYVGLISHVNVLTDLDSFIDMGDMQFGDSISLQVAMDLVADQWIRLGNVGPPDRQKIRAGRLCRRPYHVSCRSHIEAQLLKGFLGLSAYRSHRRARAGKNNYRATGQPGISCSSAPRKSNV